MAYSIELSSVARGHLETYRKRDQQIIVDAIDSRLSDEPLVENRNRKQLDPNPVAPWELRVRHFRVFYDVSVEEELVVILAIGHKVHNVLYIGGEEFDL
jgi:mRNA-degrading endonuclease RelE of RelBE toxin-antitoxin system